VLFVLLSLVREAAVPKAESGPALEVELVAASPALPRSGPDRIPVPAAPVTEAREAAVDGTIRPSRMLSAATLADRRSAAARALLAELAPEDRVEQLCGIEAMAQVAAWRPGLEPDQVVAYAFADPRRVGSVLVADGAALHAGGAWYRLRFHCGLAPGDAVVASFQFTLGEAVPRRDWERYRLPEAEAGD